MAIVEPLSTGYTENGKYDPRPTHIMRNNRSIFENESINHSTKDRGVRDRYSEEQKKRHDVRPGITGWAQVNGRNAISWEDKFKFDVWYIKNVSIILDFKILWLTFIKVFNRLIQVTH